MQLQQLSVMWRNRGARLAGGFLLLTVQVSLCSEVDSTSAPPQRQYVIIICGSRRLTVIAVCLLTQASPQKTQLVF